MEHLTVEANGASFHVARTGAIAVARSLRASCAIGRIAKEAFDDAIEAFTDN